MRGNKAITPSDLREQALLLLRKNGLDPFPAENDEIAVELFIDNTFRVKWELMALESDEPEVTYDELKP